MDIKITKDNRDFDLLKNQWNDLAARANVHIFQTFEWNRTWWKYFGSEGNLNIILFYQEDQLVGIAPFFWDTVHIFGKKIYNCLRFIGSNVSQPMGEPLIGFVAYTDYLDIIVAPGYEKPVATKLANYFKQENLAYDEILLEEVPKTSMIHTHLVPALKKNGNDTLVCDDSSSVKILLNNSWDEYLKNVGKNRRKKIRRNLRTIGDEKQKIFELQEIRHPHEVSELFKTLVQMHQQQWNSQGFPGMFYEKRVHDFINETSLQFFSKGWLQIRKVIPVDDNEGACVAIDMFYRYKNRVYSIIGGMDYQSPFVSKSPGNVIFAATLKKAIEEEKCEVFDYLRGLHGYKLKKGDTVTTNKKIMIQHPERKNKWRVNLIKKFVHAKRRIRVEVIQFKLPFREKNLIDGFRNYLSFLSDRIEMKWESTFTL